MGYGTNDVAITTNDLVKRFAPTLVDKIEEIDLFSQFFAEDRLPPGTGGNTNYEIDSTANEAETQAPLAARISKRRDAYEVEIVTKDKDRESWLISWEKIRRGRINEPSAAVDGVAKALARKRNTRLGDFLVTGALTSSTGRPVDPAAAAVGQTPNWWNTNDTIAPPTYGAKTFSAGHDHVETGVTAVTLDRLRVYREHIVEHGYGRNGLLCVLSAATDKTLLQAANVAQQNQTAGVRLRDELQRLGSVAGMSGLAGLTMIQSQWVTDQAIGLWDDQLRALSPYGGAVRVIEQDPVHDTEDDKNHQGTWFEAWEQYRAGILHKGAGYSACIA